MTILFPLQCYGWTIWVVWSSNLSPNTGWKVTESSGICIAPGVILGRFRSDGLLTVARAKIMSSRLKAFLRHVVGPRPFLKSQVSAQALASGSFLNIPLRSCLTKGAVEALLFSVG